jgi:predicted Zn-dependent protease
MQALGPFRCIVQQACKLRLSAFILLILSSSLFAQNNPTPVAHPQDTLAISPNVSPQFPAELLCRFPKNMVTPSVAAPPKKIEPKYDIALIGQRGVGKGLDFYSLEREMLLGKELSKEVENSVHLVNDPMVTEYVNRIGQQLVRNSDAKVPFTIKVIDDDQVNAFALPGGYFYVNTGLILAADNEAGLAGVMAHEIAHVAARHATKNQSRQQLFDLVSLPLVFFGGPAAMIARQAMGFAIPMGLLKFSRDAEREADMLGLQYDYASGYDPQEFVRLFERMKRDEKGKNSLLSKAFSTHPMTDDRIKRAQKEIEQYLPPRQEYVVDTSEFQQVRARVVEICNRRRVDNGRVNLPVLHRRGPTEDTKPNSNPEESRPTLQHKY